MIELPRRVVFVLGFCGLAVPMQSIHDAWQGVETINLVELRLRWALLLSTPMLYVKTVIVAQRSLARDLCHRVDIVRVLDFIHVANELRRGEHEPEALWARSDGGGRTMKGERWIASGLGGRMRAGRHRGGAEVHNR